MLLDKALKRAVGVRIGLLYEEAEDVTGLADLAADSRLQRRLPANDGLDRLAALTELSDDEGWSPVCRAGGKPERGLLGDRRKRLLEVVYHLEVSRDRRGGHRLP